MNILIAILIVVVVCAAILYLLKKGGAESTENDAKRFARLLVAEIKLYNEAKVQRGLQNKNVAEVLRDEIADARTKYKKRISEPNSENYFNEALIEILANGDARDFDASFRINLK